ncbi:hypothetical protein CIG75_01455 [Tumebacillus algifaecis]|uniref:Uncharacterized protein n=1 Tax=Tumebacillus algifaecis TaxID=1214604 RepID=A0A223CX57_9BACL|nr:hypothetical protein CIG75_01455 [Tumebacillus algifaecis]
MGVMWKQLKLTNTPQSNSEIEQEALRQSSIRIMERMEIDRVFDRYIGVKSKFYAAHNDFVV